MIGDRGFLDSSSRFSKIRNRKPGYQKQKRLPRKGANKQTLGIEAYPVHIEVDTNRQLPTFTVVGLPDGAVRESKERVMAAIRNAGFQWPRRRVTVNLAPADIKKEGSAFDLPIAVGILVASEQLKPARLGDFVLFGGAVADRHAASGAGDAADGAEHA